ncbi:prolyl oligopeptidase family protein [Micrococcus sp. TA1]|uniref:prolyl oligopeptidase family serine peptidase n=1 Tax=Micrococcus sp. TA1 TaxID=681627 RepID=UPI0017B0CC9E|nr:prolyl oligopeptidase family serine peptidase [Micrococcus sp. TA1]MBB5747752.1 prolyl oligopeptidase [Micrococcus sp. TA1]
MAKTPPVTGTDDEFLWLEDIHGERPLEWVRRQNARTEAQLDTEGFHRLRDQVTEVLDAPDRIPHVSKRGGMYYNFWRDAEHPRGVWRRTDWESYLAGDPDWDVLLDVGRLAEEEGTPWVFSGARLLRPDWDRALVRLSPDGGDAVAVREFDLAARAFVPAGGRPGDGEPSAGTDASLPGFSLPVAKTQASWIDRDHLLVGTVTDPDPDAGDATQSSYASTLRILARGQSLQEAQTVFSVDRGHVAAFGGHDSTPGWERTVAIDAIDFYRSTTWLRDPEADGPRPGWRLVDVPEDAEVDVHRQWLVLFLKSDWDRSLPDGTTVRHPSGSLLVCTVTGLLGGTEEPQLAFVPGPEATLSSWSWTRSHLVLTVLRHVASSVLVLPQSFLGTPDAAASARPLVLQTPNPADPYLTLSVGAVDDEDEDCGDDLWITATGALTPPTLLRATLPAVLPAAPSTGPAGSAGSGAPGPGTGAAGVVPALVTVRTAPHRFDATGLCVRQFFAVSADGTRVPYFQVGPEDLAADGTHPVLMDGYGGFLASKLPAYSGVHGLGWLTRVNDAGRSGIHVIANIRGGGEYGPVWHRAALRENRHRAYEDFAAVARDLVRRGVTDRAHLAATGRSNGGLLMGVMATRYPELFGALSCGVPLLDMRRYTALSAGHSWIAEYGDPDDADQWEFIRTFSPYHLLLDEPVADAAQGRDGAGAGSGHPDLLVWTATSDDRVGPVQARKMAARMQRLGVPNAWFHEDLEGGHAGASDNRQAAAMHARSLEFLWQSVGDGARVPAVCQDAGTADPAGVGGPAR